MIDGALLFQDLAPAVEFGWSGRVFVFVLLVGVPFLALLQPDDRELVLPPRSSLYVSAIAGILILAMITVLVLILEDTSLAAIGLHGTSLPGFLGWTVAVTVATLAGNFVISRAAHGLGLRESRLTYHLMPRSVRDRRLFMGVSASAGFGEELTYHGFLLVGLNGWLGNGWLAAVIANLAFGVLHGYQGPAGIVRAFAMGYVLCLPVIVGAGLWPSITAHFLVNALLGLGLWKLMVSSEEMAALASEEESELDTD
ncbi:MAG: CPBP family intramembrane metalloprotease [Gemmatimonadetes bacterium]|uniref:CPBP family intramembrane metalloprotease n=1 Tax=Candidatus Kutchimonas denitrificans TaxID=3056748 RepID=A0AAE4Z555_9BACT|nr:CPBP family intramembrane metalloprotease [Gemmatimonadota bacterium]NIR73974.1 CPBP family intramembrane metalloprotease [Candidatus Kutchimonas denitrificans]NIS02963.1 CPBP family intramembrane metalloprotease [Gemmatimonadota bacterium]NIT68680.1 CPBP family intramembrane metalloprotease [Gemmatimonadota bacterium]NIU53261.1 CPBP family intramembrane metalloprotease [Gemmatimonadota bacterium]